MSLAAKEWNKYKNANSIVTAGDKSKTVSPKKVIDSDDDDSDDESASSSDNESSEDEQPKSKAARPMSMYAKFISEEVKRQIEKEPGLQNKEYMYRAAKQWDEYKKKIGIKPNQHNVKPVQEESESEESENHSSSSSDSEESEDEKEVPQSKPTKKRDMSPYQKFVSEELARQRQANPGLQNKQYMILVAKAWNEHKKTLQS